MPTCKECGEEFDLLPNKPGFANVCPTCTESPEEKARKVEEQERLRKQLRKSKRINKRTRDQSRREAIVQAELTIKADRQLDALGLEKVPGKSFTVRVPIKSELQN